MLIKQKVWNLKIILWIPNFNLPKRPWDAPLHTLSKLYDVPVGFVHPRPFEVVYWFYLRSHKGSWTPNEVYAHARRSPVGPGQSPGGGPGPPPEVHGFRVLKSVFKAWKISINHKFKTFISSRKANKMCTRFYFVLNSLNIFNNLTDCWKKIWHMEKFLPLYSWGLNHVIQLYAYSLHGHVTTIQMQSIDFTPKTKNMNYS